MNIAGSILASFWRQRPPQPVSSDARPVPGLVDT
jgi:hypothetical protein